MIEIVPARAEMAREIRVQQMQQLTGMAVTEENMAEFIRSGPAFACVDGRVLAILGIMPLWHDRSLGWGVLSDSIGATMTQVHRAVLRGLNDLFVVKRVEAYVAAGHQEGFRWMRLLGFEYEGTMRQFLNGQDFAMFARVRE